MACNNLGKKNKRQKLSSKREQKPKPESVVLIVDGETEVAYFKRIDELKIFPKLKFKLIIGEELYLEYAIQEHDNENMFIILDIDDCRTLDNNNRESRIRSLMNDEDCFNNPSSNMCQLFNKLRQINDGLN